MNKNKKIAILIVILIVFIILILIAFIRKNPEKPSAVNLEDKLIVIAEELEKENAISLMESSGEPHITYNLKTLNEVYHKDIKEFKNCDLDNTYVTIYPERNKNAKYEVNLVCK